MDVISLIVGLAASIAIAIWQNRRAATADRRLREFAEALPKKIADELQRVLAAMPHDKAQLAQGPDDRPEAALGAEFEHVDRVTYVDIDGDGRSELLISYYTGAHAAGLTAFKWEDFTFRPIGELWSDSGTQFDVSDIDGDGIPEVQFWMSDRRSWELAYAFRPSERITAKWENGGFREVAVEPQVSESELASLIAEYRAGL